MLLSYAEFKVALWCSEEFSIFFPLHLQSGGHSEALGRGSSSSRMGRCGAQRTGPRGLRSLTGARAIGRSGQSALSAASPAPPGQLALGWFLHS